MKVLNLRCANEHGFEGWFASEEDFQSQMLRGLVECPLCADTAIERLPSAPRLNVAPFFSWFSTGIFGSMASQATAPTA